MAEETLLTGRQGRQYRILAARPIDHGSTSQLYLGEQVAPEQAAGRQVAIKVALGPDARPLFEKEAEVLSLLSDIVPGAVPQLYDSNLGARRPYLVMEYLAATRSLADLAQDRPQGYLSEKEAVTWACRYGEVLGALHDVDFAVPDRKLGDLLLVPGPAASGGDPGTGQDEWRLVVVDWGGVASLTPSLAQFDLLLFAQFWYRLMLGGYSLPDVRLGARRPEHHNRWQELSYGAQQILSRGLSRVAQRRYRETADTLADWRELELFWGQSPEDREQAFEQARQERAYEKALKCLDIIRVADHPRWQRYQGEVDALLVEIDIANALVKQIKEAIRRGESLADANVREPLARGAAEYGDDPEWQLRAHRWQLLAEFSGSLADESLPMFREEGGAAWIQAVEAMEEEKWGEALDLFWEPLHRLVSPNLEHPNLEARMLRARELLHAGKRIEAQGEIEAVVEESAALESPALSAAVNLLHNAFLPRYSRWGGILSLLIEAELRQHMLSLAANLSLGRQKDVYASADAIRSLQGQLAYAPLLEGAGVIWPPELLKSLDQQLELCQKAAEVLAEAAELLGQGKFEQARWILSATDRQFDFSKPGQPDSAQSLISEVNGLTQATRQQLKAELKKASDSIQAEKLLAQTGHSADVSQVLAALEAAAKVVDIAYLRPRAAGLIEQVSHILRSGPALVTLEDKRTRAGRGDVE
jgi:hypothetical protein